MGIPDFQTLMLPLLKLAGDEKEHRLSDAVEELSTSSGSRKRTDPRGSRAAGRPSCTTEWAGLART